MSVLPPGSMTVACRVPCDGPVCSHVKVALTSPVRDSPEPVPVLLQPLTVTAATSSNALMSTPMHALIMSSPVSPMTIRPHPPSAVWDPTSRDPHRARIGGDGVVSGYPDIHRSIPTPVSWRPDTARYGRRRRRSLNDCRRGSQCDRERNVGRECICTAEQQRQ